ncbi:MAG: helix-turn-helix transcriptional regulator, partial [Bacteroidales bacterium]|nr:helix-turn-helix transcriptional regulator [Bacteroidales bacterium]
LIENYSNPNMGNHRWLLQFFLLVLVLNFIGLVKNVLRISSSEIIFNYAAIAVVIGILVFVSWVLIKSLRQPGVFTGVYSDMQLVKRMLMEPESGTKVSNESLRLIQKIKVHMEEQEPYLDSSLSMHELAGQLNMKVKDLSLLINHTLNQHFFDFVNQYRINRASEILSDPDNKQVTVLEVLYEVGFNSKSSFNTTFKKLTGQTPTQFRKSKLV